MRSPAIGRPLTRRFYARSSVALARAVLGRLLVHRSRDGLAAGWIVEAEAYAGERDPASHAYRGPTRRNAAMFGPPGHAYVYFTYGMHHCLNLVAGREGRAQAVLVRALEPAFDLSLMRERRGGVSDERLARGPACLTVALGLDLAHDGVDLTKGRLWISDLPARRGGRSIAAGRRIGIRRAVARPWRFHLKEHPCVSGPRAGARRSAQRPIRAGKTAGSSASLGGLLRD